MTDEPVIVEAVMIGSGSLDSSEAGQTRARMIEQAMSDAVTTAMEEGISDPEEIKARMLAAREAVKAA